MYRAAVVQYFLTSENVPKQGYKGCTSLTKLAERYGVKRLDHACERLLGLYRNALDLHIEYNNSVK